MAYEEQEQPAGAGEVQEKPEVSLARKALVNEWLGKINAAKEHWKPVFKDMRTSMDFAMYGADKKWREGGNYTVPILPRYINQAVSQLYAKNPTTIWKRRKRLRYQLWDGRADTLQAAMEMAQMGDPGSVMLLQEVAAARQEELMLDRMGETLQILWDYYLGEQGANYKQQIKAAVRRVKTCKVAWIKLGYQRMLEPNPEVDAEIRDATKKLAAIEQALQEVANGKLRDDQAEMEKLRLNLADLQRDQFLITREGPVLDFPRSDQIIVDPACRHLKSLTGAGWVAHEFEMSPATIKQTWKVDIGEDFKAYDQHGKVYRKAGKEKQCARVYEVWDKDNQQKFVIVDGYSDFVKEPATPDVFMERFWPFFPIVFNEVEHHEDIFPLSDVEQAKDIQNEYNRSREALRQHRIASLPFWVEGAGMSEEEKKKLANRAPHEIISLATLGTNQKPADLLQAGPTAPIDPNLYELESHFVDLMRVIGYQEAQLGGVSGATATESSIAQQSQSASQGDNVDDLDEVLTELAKAAGQVMLLNVDKQTVVEIVGEGAVWPDSPETREAAAKEIYLEVESGSSGRPNKAADLANMERGMPYLLQIPGLNPVPIGKKYLKLLDIDVDEATAEGMPSIQAINAIMAKMATGAGAQATGDPASDPNAQGDQGAQNAPSPVQNEAGPQPAYTAPAPPA